MSELDYDKLVKIKEIMGRSFLWDLRIQEALESAEEPFDLLKYMRGEQ